MGLNEKIKEFEYLLFHVDPIVIPPKTQTTILLPAPRKLLEPFAQSAKRVSAPAEVLGSARTRTSLYLTPRNGSASFLANYPPVAFPALRFPAL